MAALERNAISNIRTVHSRRMIAAQMTGVKFAKPHLMFKNGKWLCATPNALRELIATQGTVFPPPPFAMANRPDIALAKWAFSWMLARPSQGLPL